MVRLWSTHAESLRLNIIISQKTRSGGGGNTRRPPPIRHPAGSLTTPSPRRHCFRLLCAVGRGKNCQLRTIIARNSCTRIYYYIVVRLGSRAFRLCDPFSTNNADTPRGGSPSSSTRILKHQLPTGPRSRIGNLQPVWFHSRSGLKETATRLGAQRAVQQFSIFNE